MFWELTWGFYKITVGNVGVGSAVKIQVLLQPETMRQNLTF